MSYGGIWRLTLGRGLSFQTLSRLHYDQILYFGQGLGRSSLPLSWQCHGKQGVRRLMSGRGRSTPSSWNSVENGAGVLGCSPWKLALEGFALSLYLDPWQQLEQLAGTEGRLSGNWAKLRNVLVVDKKDGEELEAINQHTVIDHHCGPTRY